MAQISLGLTSKSPFNSLDLLPLAACTEDHRQTADLLLPARGYYCVGNQFLDSRDSALLAANRAEMFHVAAFSRKDPAFKHVTHLSGIGIKFQTKQALLKSLNFMSILPPGMLLPDGNGTGTVLLRFDATYPAEELCVAELKAVFEGLATVTTQIPWNPKARLVKQTPATTPKAIKAALDGAIQKLKTEDESASDNVVTTIDSESDGERFIRELCGGRGYLNLRCLKGKIVANRNFQSSADAWDYAQRQASGEWNVYLATAAVSNDRPALASQKNDRVPNFLSTSSVPIDFDVARNGEADSKHYATKAESLEGMQRLRNVLSAAGSSPMIIVDSGGGTQAHVMLAGEIDAVTRRRLGQKIERLALQMGEKPDPAVTKDSVRVMRVPGTRNFKYGKPRPVSVVEWNTTRIDPAGLEAQLDRLLKNSEAVSEPIMQSISADDPVAVNLLGSKRESKDPLPAWEDACYATLMEALTHPRIHEVASPDWNETQGQVLSALKKSVELTPYEYERQAEERCRELYLKYALNNRRGYTREQVEADWDGNKFGGFSRSPFYIVEIAQKLGFDCNSITGKGRPASVTGAIKGDVKLIRASEITVEGVRWAWEGQLAKGKIHILGGKPGTSKTTLAMNLAAIISSGGILPDGKQCSEGNVLIWSGEDDPKDTLVPRLIANGANTDRVFFVDATLDANGNMLPFDPARDIARLEETAKALGSTSMVIVDPIVSAVAGDGNSNSEVRRDLQPLVDLAENLDCAVLGITHFTKGSGGQAAVDRITGSLAFGAVARIIHVCFRPKDKTDGEFAFMRGKSNISAVGGGFLYDIEQIILPGTNIEASRIKWRGTISGLAEDALAKAEADEKDKPALDFAKEFLSERLANGPVQFVDLVAEAKAEGVSESTLQRARRELNVQHDKWGFGKNGTTWWGLLTDEWPSDWEQRKQEWTAKKKA